MSDGEWRTVWVLGSGFSQPLGGPPLDRLLTRTAFADFAARYPNVYEPNRWPMDAVEYLYHYGTRFAQGPGPRQKATGEALWAHAEEFLDRLDAAVADEAGVLARQLVMIANSRPEAGPRTTSGLSKARRFASVDALRAAARRVVAAQCSTFALESDINSERWHPFKDWVGALGPFDSVITFNYDPVLELLNEDHKLQFMLPGGRDLDQGRAPVYKLHGSVNWKRDADKIEEQKEFDFGAKCPPGELAIATPGATKYLHVSTLFRKLWWKAESALSDANAVVFIGYRFPPSDAHSRERLLRALWKNTSKNLHVYIVLGPNVHHEDVVRLHEMLRWSIQSSAVAPAPMLDIRALPLYAQDYLTVWRLDPATRNARGEPPEAVP